MNGDPAPEPAPGGPYADPVPRANILIALAGGPESDDTCRFGGRIAKAVQADLSVLYVQPRTHHRVRHELRFAHRKLAEWEIELPGIRVLRQAREILRAMGLLRTDRRGDLDTRHELRPDVAGAYELHVYGRGGESIRFRLREGDAVDQVIEEVRRGDYELLVIGAGHQRRMLQKLAQFSTCSVLIVRGPFRLDFDFLVCTDGSPESRHAAAYGARLAAFFGGRVRVLAVADSEEGRARAEAWVKRASRLLAKVPAPYETTVRVGRLIDTIVKEAGSDHLVVLGPTKASELRQFFVGSTPVRVAMRAAVPVLLVK